MKNIILKKLAIGVVVWATTASAWGICAKPGLIKYTQPDGSELMIRMAGDAWDNAVFSEDGLLLHSDAKGEYHYVVGTSEESYILSENAAKIPQARTATEISALKKIDQQKLANFKNTRNLITNGNKKSLPGLFDDSYPTIGKQKALVILVEYADVKFSTDNAQQYFSDLLNKENFDGFGATGSARDWFLSNSNGIFDPEFDVYGPVTLPQDRAYYGSPGPNGGEPNAYRMVTDAAGLLDGVIDFTQYDRDEDGTVDNIFVFFAGFGQHDSGIAKAVWPHSGNISTFDSYDFRFDGVQIDRYACSSELIYGSQLPDGIGTFVHEFSHVMGLPDLYATTYTNSFTPGSWSVLDSGPYNNNGRTPPNYSSFERCALGWMQPQELTNSGAYELLPLHTSNHAYIVRTEKENEYFLLENRQMEGFDKFIPGHGMLVWHIDFNRTIWTKNTVNNKPNHLYVDLIEADDVKTEGSRAGDSFPGTADINEYGPDTTPAFKNWSRQPVGVALTDINEDYGIIRFKAEVDASSIAIINQSETFTIEGSTIVSDHPHQLYSINGQLVSSSCSTTLTSKGIYILKIGSEIRKIHIK